MATSSVTEMESYISPNITLQDSSISGKGLFAIHPIKKGELLIDFTPAPGKYLTEQEADVFYDGGNDYMLQVDDDLFFVATTDDELEVSDYLNHSCEPTCGVRGIFQFVALKDIKPGDEITFDYAMTESSEYSINCHCGKPTCRVTITGDDWKIKELQRKYKGFFSAYIQKKLNTIHS
jgi:uncharacterized protein